MSDRDLESGGVATSCTVKECALTAAHQQGGVGVAVVVVGVSGVWCVWVWGGGK